MVGPSFTLGRPGGDDRRGSRISDPFYNTTEWKDIRVAQLNAEPLCRLCAANDLVTAATVCDRLVTRGVWD